MNVAPEIKPGEAARLRELVAAIGKFLGYREWLTQERCNAPASSMQWQPKKKFADLPASAQSRTLQRRTVMQAFYSATKMGFRTVEAQRAAGAVSLLEYGEAPCCRTIRRFANRVSACGGPELAPIEAYADGKSCPHPNARKPRERMSRER
jgi:hypothetical protein